MAFQSSYKVVTIFTIFSCILDYHPSKCEITDYKRIDIKELLQQKDPQMIYEKNGYFDEDKAEDNVANDHIQEMLNKLSDVVKDNDDLNVDKHSRTLRNGKSESDTSDPDSSEENIQAVLNTNGNFKQLLNDVLRSDKRFNVTGDGENREKIELGQSHNDKELTKEKLKFDTNVFKNNITLRSSCNKGAAKACKKACQGVLKNVCREFRCSHGMKSRFKLECKKNCRNKFDA